METQTIAIKEINNKMDGFANFQARTEERLKQGAEKIGGLEKNYLSPRLIIGWLTTLIGIATFVMIKFN